MLIAIRFSVRRLDEVSTVRLPYQSYTTSNIAPAPTDVCWFTTLRVLENLGEGHSRSFEITSK